MASEGASVDEGTFSGRVALVTGGSRGIGRAVCARLAADGVSVAINYASNADAASETLEFVRKEGVDGVTVQGDVGVPADVDRIVRDVQAALGPIDLLVNNAAINDDTPPGELDLERWRRVFAVNLDAAFLFTWALKDSMISRRYGRIVNVSSMAGLVPKQQGLAYSTSKAALVHFTRNCALQLAPHVRVNCVAVGMTDTEMLRRSWDRAGAGDVLKTTPLGRIAEPEEIASVVRFLLSDESSYVTGDVIIASGGRS